MVFTWITCWNSRELVYYAATWISKTTNSEKNTQPRPRILTFHTPGPSKFQNKSFFRSTQYESFQESVPVLLSVGNMHRRSSYSFLGVQKLCCEVGGLSNLGANGYGALWLSFSELFHVPAALTGFIGLYVNCVGWSLHGYYPAVILLQLMIDFSSSRLI